MGTRAQPKYRGCPKGRTATAATLTILIIASFGCRNSEYPRAVCCVSRTKHVVDPEYCDTVLQIINRAFAQIHAGTRSFEITLRDGTTIALSLAISVDERHLAPDERYYILYGAGPHGFLQLKVRDETLIDVSFEEAFPGFPRGRGRKCYFTNVTVDSARG